MVGRLKFSGERWTMHRLPPAYDSRAISFRRRYWSPALGSHRCDRAAWEVFCYGDWWPNSEEISVVADSSSLKFGPVVFDPETYTSNTVVRGGFGGRGLLSR
ncbi:Uncharacterized protein Rs2_05351 [Raphanus sativus]|nr:Uncharacterized protein Rs2_05351 [Raphanus sativus]